MFDLNLATTPMWLMSFLAISDGLWIATYILCIRQAAKDKVYAIPPTALAANWMLEITFTLIYPPPPPVGYAMVPMALFTTILAYQYFKYAKNDPSLPNIHPKWMLPIFVLSCVMSMPLVMATTHHFQDNNWHISNFVVLLDSALWVHMILRRNDMRGQSLYIGLCKGIGSAGVAVAFVLLFGINHPLIIISVILTAILDVWYVGLIFVKCRELGINPWQWNRESQAAQPTLAAN